MRCASERKEGMSTVQFYFYLLRGLLFNEKASLNIKHHWIILAIHKESSEGVKLTTNKNICCLMFEWYF